MNLNDFYLPYASMLLQAVRRLDESVLIEDVFLVDYVSFRNDRNARGGVVFLLAKDNVDLLLDISDANIYGTSLCGHDEVRTGTRAL